MSRAGERPIRLGRRQRDVLAAARAGKADVHHAGQGRMDVYGIDGAYGEDVLERLFDLGLVEHGDERVAGYTLRLTDEGEAALARGEAHG